MNWDYILSVTPRFIHATLMTLHLAFWGILLSLVIGVILWGSDNICIERNKKIWREKMR